MNRVKCPDCGKEAKIIPFGHGLLAVCCGKIIYREDKNTRYKNIPEKTQSEMAR
jgi:hypothetical protein